MERRRRMCGSAERERGRREEARAGAGELGGYVRDKPTFYQKCVCMCVREREILHKIRGFYFSFFNKKMDGDVDPPTNTETRDEIDPNADESPGSMILLANSSWSQSIGGVSDPV